MTINNPYKAYQQNSVTTASPGELTLMLYNGCIKFIGKAITAIEGNNISERNTNIQKAQNIIRELMVTLNMDMEVSRNMMVLYDYVLDRLTYANVKNNVQALKDAESLVIEFRDTWKQVIQLNRQKQYQGGSA